MQLVFGYLDPTLVLHVLKWARYYRCVILGLNRRSSNGGCPKSCSQCDAMLVCGRFCHKAYRLKCQQSFRTNGNVRYLTLTHNMQKFFLHKDINKWLTVRHRKSYELIP